MTMSDLEIAPGVAFSLVSAMARRYGLVLFCGPTGAGKSTTVAAVVERLRSGRRVLTVRDLSPPVSASMDEGCICDVGDIRDTDVAQTAAELAGRTTVVAVLRSGDSYAAVDRLIDMGVPRAVLKRASPVVVTQRLCRRLCGHCRRASPASEESLRYLGIPRDQFILTSGHVYEA